MLRLWQLGSTVIRVGSRDASLEFPLRGSSWAPATVSLSGGRFPVMSAWNLRRMILSVGTRFRSRGDGKFSGAMGMLRDAA